VGNKITDRIQPGDVIEVVGPHHTSRHIILDKYIESGMPEYNIPDESTLSTYVIHCVSEKMPHLNKVNKIWKFSLENYLKRELETRVTIL
tara:strand:- start:18 stop:287 length:270 start_codon:yes stop_codon:yes gene_type:complete